VTKDLKEKEKEMPPREMTQNEKKTRGGENVVVGGSKNSEGRSQSDAKACAAEEKSVPS